MYIHIEMFYCSARFNTIQQKSEQKWRYYRYSVFAEYKDKIPSPLNFPIRMYKYFTKCCPCCKESEKGNAILFQVEKMNVSIRHHS